MAEEKYFAASNTSAGFISYFDRVFSPSELSRLYIIKSGAGTGKSSMMRRIADAAEKNGRKVVYYYCSSDPYSLDGIVVPSLALGVIDGTAPHMTDPKYPGAADTILDFYPYLNEKMLTEKRKKIIELTDKNKALHKKSSSYRRFAGLAEREALSVISGCIDREKLNAAVSRFAAAEKGEGGGKHRQISAFSTRGKVRFDTFEQMSDSVVAVCDEHGAAYLFMNALKAALSKKGVPFYYSTETLLPENCEAIYLPQTRRSFVITGKPAETDKKDYSKLINMKRFIKADALKEVRGRLRMCEKTRDLLDAEAARIIAEAGKVHDELEALYNPAVDFDGVRRETERVIERELRIQN